MYIKKNQRKLQWKKKNVKLKQIAKKIKIQLWGLEKNKKYWNLKEKYLR